ncbi:BTB/POZ domain-containing protein 6-like isoform X2 [Paramacrobiotus metropolitanus]|uniref:BTB/POZ domain-containing protein 6-like isoform X2 n=1 Tax=Paramacrobiotus metropolitanus TaxID=2943436 RepID=UPI002445EC8F|nr:BTB/POZ domain-containing protein 6-like isoform X2 [Paramacrobiotus metropolitanus]
MSRNPTSSSAAGNRAGILAISDGMQYLLSCEELSDVQFAVGRDYGAVRLFPALRPILSVRSAVFYTMFYGSIPENCTVPIEIPDILPEAFGNMISYIYTDTVKNLTSDNVFHTLGCADKYDLPLLVAMCTDFVLNNLSIRNCLDVLDSAVHYAVAAPGILERCFSLTDESATSVWKSQQFCEIGEDALRSILQRDTLTANEDTICSAVDKWAAAMCARKNLDASPTNRREILGQTLFLIRFPLLTDAQLLDGPVKSGLLLQSELMAIYHYKYAAIKPQLPFPTEPRQNVRGEGVITYTIPDVRKLQDTYTHSSDPIIVRKMLWSIAVQKRTDGGSATLGFYLRCWGCPELASWKCQVNGEMRLLPLNAETALVSKRIDVGPVQQGYIWMGIPEIYRYGGFTGSGKRLRQS